MKVELVGQSCQPDWCPALVRFHSCPRLPPRRRFTAPIHANGGGAFDHIDALSNDRSRPKFDLPTEVLYETSSVERPSPGIKSSVLQQLLRNETNELVHAGSFLAFA